MPEIAQREALHALLESAVGERQAVTADALAEKIGLVGKYRDRTVRLMIEDLLWEEDLAVVAGGAGYFKPETWAEWQEYDRQMRGRIAEDCKRKAQVKKNVYNLFHGMKRVRLI